MFQLQGELTPTRWNRPSRWECACASPHTGLQRRQRQCTVRLSAAQCGRERPCWRQLPCVSVAASTAFGSANTGIVAHRACTVGRHDWRLSLERGHLVWLGNLIKVLAPRRTDEAFHHWHCSDGGWCSCDTCGWKCCAPGDDRWLEVLCTW